MPAASARASTRCLRRPDPGPRSAGTTATKLDCAAAALGRDAGRISGASSAAPSVPASTASAPRMPPAKLTNSHHTMLARHLAGGNPYADHIRRARRRSGFRCSHSPCSAAKPLCSAAEILCSFRGNFKNYGSFQEVALGLGENFPAGRENHGNAHGRPQGCTQGRPWLAADCRREATPSPSARIRPNSTSGIRSDEVYARNCTPPPISARYTIR